MKPQTVYILDDEADQVELLSNAIDKLGISNRGYTSARQLFANLSHFNSETILVLDLHLPDVDGIEVMRHLAKLDDPPALVLISGRGSRILHSAQELGKIHNLNILATLHKPFLPSTLTKTIVDIAEDCDRNSGSTNSNKLINRIDAKELQESIDAGQLELYYQPQVTMTTGAVCGVEALVRWINPKYAGTQTEDFIEVVESYNLTPHLTHWVLHEAMQQIRKWKQAGFDLVLSVNISAKDVFSLGFPEDLFEQIQVNHLDATKLTLEMTESSLMDELAKSLDIMTRLRLKKIGVSIDDFGTGYSSLSLLHRVPFDQLKIDRSFVQGIPDNQEACAIVNTCIVLGHELSMQVVAEGVENQIQWDLLKDTGCDVAQGFFIQRPLSSQAMTEYLSNH